MSDALEKIVDKFIYGNRSDRARKLIIARSAYALGRVEQREIDAKIAEAAIGLTRREISDAIRARKE
jgi:hypothetical protein